MPRVTKVSCTRIPRSCVVASVFILGNPTFSPIPDLTPLVKKHSIVSLSSYVIVGVFLEKLAELFKIVISNSFQSSPSSAIHVPFA